MKILFDLFDMIEREVECIVDAGAYLDKYWWFFYTQESLSMADICRAE